MTRVRDLFLPLIGIGVVVALWWAGIALFADGFLRRFGPEPAGRALLELLRSGELWPHAIASLRRILTGLAISAAVGVPVGLLVGLSRTAQRLTGAVFQFLRMVSPLSWTPLAIILLGVGDKPVFFLVAIGAVWPVVLNTAAGVAALDPRWLQVGRGLGATRWELLVTVIWPGIRAHMLTGLRLAVGLAWIILVPAEMLGVDSGLGYLILDARDRLAYGEVVAVMIVIGVCGFVLDFAARLLLAERRGALRLPVRRRAPVRAGLPRLPLGTEDASAR